MRYFGHSSSRLRNHHPNRRNTFSFVRNLKRKILNQYNLLCMFQRYYVYILMLLKLNRKTMSSDHKIHRLLCLIFELYVGYYHLVEWYLNIQNLELIFELPYYHNHKYTDNTMKTQT